MPDLCASYQQAVIDALSRKMRVAIEQGGALRYRSLGLSGGVSNNKTLRAALGTLAKHKGLPLLAAQPQHTGDNAGMIVATLRVPDQGTNGTFERRAASA